MYVGMYMYVSVNLKLLKSSLSWTLTVAPYM